MGTRGAGRALAAGVGAVLLALALAVGLLVRGDRRALAGAAGGGPEVRVGEALGAPADEGYARALEPRPLRFPDDHGPQGGGG